MDITFKSQEIYSTYTQYCKPIQEYERYYRTLLVPTWSVYDFELAADMISAMTYERASSDQIDYKQKIPQKEIYRVMPQIIEIFEGQHDPELGEIKPALNLMQSANPVEFLDRKIRYDYRASAVDFTLRVTRELGILHITPISLQSALTYKCIADMCKLSIEPNKASLIIDAIEWTSSSMLGIYEGYRDWELMNLKDRS